MYYSPLEQFMLTGSNMAIYLAISLILGTLIIVKGIQGEGQLISVEAILASIVELLLTMAQDSIGRQMYQSYLPLYLTLLVFILVANLLGNTPYAFAVTSHLTVAVVISMVLLIGLTMIGLMVWQYRVGALFLPTGTPLLLAPLLVAIETVSYMARALSLGIRLAANIMAGHSLLHIIAGFITKLGKYGLLVLICPIALLISLLAMELTISILQAYVFCLLAISYLSNVLLAS